MTKQRVFIDTNAIFPAVKAGEWKRLCNHYSIETVAEIVSETQRGRSQRRSYVTVPANFVSPPLIAVHKPSDEDLAAFALLAEEHNLEIDEGEYHLLAWLHAHEKPRSGILVLTTSDRSALRAACTLSWSDSLISLEKLLRDAGSPPAKLRDLDQHVRESWLADVRTNFILKLVK